MARYIDEILQPGEKVLYSTNAHWIHYVPGLIGWLIAAGCLVLTRTVLNETLILLCLAVSAVAALVALGLTMRAWFHRWTTETDVTNLRVVHKEGFITRKTFEISIDKVASVQVDQSIFGRIFNYGDVTLETMGDEEKKIETIARPLQFRSTITTR
jgi:uncharacterized membrane protein YdbT with pleckstrin-like domain